ncbi:MAG: hypothetical protein J5843_00990 [Clostridia bacterium]|nr:hypothetical protein [Clostridia bacterium]
MDGFLAQRADTAGRLLAEQTVQFRALECGGFDDGPTSFLVLSRSLYPSGRQSATVFGKTVSFSVLFLVFLVFRGRL